MRRIWRWLAIGAGVAALWAAGFFWLNQNSVASARDVERRGADSLPAAPREISLLAWNLGYGGLGKDSDFVADGGQHMFPPSRRVVRANVAGIAAFLEGRDEDVILLQELARGGPVNYWVNLKRRVDRALAGRERLFFADFRTRLLPPPLRMTHGQGIYSRFAVGSTHVVPLPAEDASIFGVKRRYASLVARLPMEGGGEWTIASVHLAAFDEDALVRTRQLRELLAWAESEYAAGRHVVIGGDWNLQLVETDFPHTTEDEYLFWLFPFPDDALGEGWAIAADARTPSVRTNERPYRPGENYTTVIDGFVTSPNVEIVAVEGIDLGFQHADHQPVRLVVRARQ